ncbi:MAG: hypothetical protein U0K13_01730 [Oscillospiraceae bacterium]|nr:hypothetical protein [Oscillospiraceae bacterium]
MKWLMAIPVWSTPRDSLNRFNLVFSRCPYEESPLAVSFFFCFAARDGKKQKSGIISQVLLYNRKKLCYHNSARLSCAFPHLGRGGFTDPPLSVGRI